MNRLEDTSARSSAPPERRVADAGLGRVVAERGKHRDCAALNRGGLRLEGVVVNARAVCRGASIC